MSHHVLPRPPDWPAATVMCGYWWPRPAAARPPALDGATRRFLDAGPAPLFVGLGSTPVADPAGMTRAVAEAAHEARARLVLQRGWAGLGEGLADPDIHVLGDADYEALFPHVAGVVHHGGAGTVALGLKFGRPTLCLPAVADQFFWGHRIAEIGAGPQPLPLRRLRRDRLAERMAALTRDDHVRRASAIADQLSAEDAGAIAVEAIERALSTP